MASCEAIPRLERPLPVGNGAELIKRRPDIRQAERQLAASTSQIGIETAALYPTVTFGAGLGLTSRMGSNEFASSAIHYSVGPLISWTFPTRKVARARIAKAGASDIGRASGRERVGQ